MSESVRSTPTRDALLFRSQSPAASRDNLFECDSTYSDYAYRVHTSNSVDEPINVSSIDLIRRVRSALDNWTSTLGPIEDWPRAFRDGYDKACMDTDAPTTQVAIDIFLGQVQEHVRIGKDIIGGLERCAALRFTPFESIKADQLLAGDLMRMLHRGVALLEARLELYAPTGANPSPLHSSLRRHEEFIA